MTSEKIITIIQLKTLHILLNLSHVNFNFNREENSIRTERNHNT